LNQENPEPKTPPEGDNNSQDKEILEFKKEAQRYISSSLKMDNDIWIKLKPEYQQATNSNEYDKILKLAKEIIHTKEINAMAWGFILSNTKTKEDHESEYSIKQSTDLLGELYPVKKDARGNIIDGFHRLAINPNWRQEIAPQIDTDKKLHLARIVANFNRRSVPPEELKASLVHLIVNEKMTPAEIAENSGISLPTIYRHIPQELKNQARVLAGKASAESRASTKTILLSCENKKEAAPTENTLIPEQKMATSATESTLEKEMLARIEADMAEFDQYKKKIERSIEKTIETAPQFPEDMMKAVYSHLSLHSKNCKVDPRKAEAYAKTLVAIMYERTAEEDFENLLTEVDNQLQ
jgi:hypothetical protein